MCLPHLPPQHLAQGLGGAQAGSQPALARKRPRQACSSGKPSWPPAPVPHSPLGNTPWSPVIASLVVVSPCVDSRQCGGAQRTTSPSDTPPHWLLQRWMYPMDEEYRPPPSPLCLDHMLLEDGASGPSCTHWALSTCPQDAVKGHSEPPPPPFKPKCSGQVSQV